MALIENNGTFTTIKGGKGNAKTQFRDNDDFSVDGFEDVTLTADLPPNVGVALIRTSDSPKDWATISLRGNNTSTVYIDNSVGNANFVVSGDTYIGYSMNTDLKSILRPKISFGTGLGFIYNYADRGDLLVAGGVYAGGVIYGGNLSGTTKYFNIEHPTKENKRLVHACLEGPENGVYVRGRLTNSNIIELPEYWAGLVDPETITVTLTQIGYSQDLIVEKIEWGKRVIIRSGSGSNIDCYYTVNGTRKDVPALEVEQDA
jgi:hypothetical protein